MTTYTYARLVGTVDDLARVKAERDALRARFEAMTADRNQLRADVQTLAAENGALRDEVEQLRERLGVTS